MIKELLGGWQISAACLLIGAVTSFGVAHWVYTGRIEAVEQKARADKLEADQAATRAKNDADAAVRQAGINNQLAIAVATNDLRTEKDRQNAELTKARAELARGDRVIRVPVFTPGAIHYVDTGSAGADPGRTDGGQTVELGEAFSGRILDYLAEGDRAIADRAALQAIVLADRKACMVATAAPAVP